jgi:hypothetical protein
MQGLINIYYEGVHAFEAGLTLEDNPHTGTLGLCWANGWRERSAIEDWTGRF